MHARASLCHWELPHLSKRRPLHAFEACMPNAGILKEIEGRYTVLLGHAWKSLSKRTQRLVTFLICHRGTRSRQCVGQTSVSNHDSQSRRMLLRT
jgi:hypothetical protein